MPPEPIEVSAGGIVYARFDEQPCILMILDVYGQWTLPKGHIEMDETSEQAALREIEEEVGIKGEIERDLGETHYQYRRDSRAIDKSVRYFLVRALGTELRLAPCEVQDAKWVSLEDALAVSGYANNRTLLEKAIRQLRKQAS